MKQMSYIYFSVKLLIDKNTTMLSHKYSPLQINTQSFKPSFQVSYFILLYIFINT